MYDIFPVTSDKPLDCGATCLKMLLAYYGHDVDLTTLIQECNTRIIGCTAGDLKRAGNAHGLDMHAYQMGADDLLKQDRPAIIHWKHGHWCVYCGNDENGKAVICNPDRGRYGMDKSIFATMYSSVALFNGEPAALPDVASQTLNERVYTLEQRMDDMDTKVIDTVEVLQILNGEVTE